MTIYIISLTLLAAAVILLRTIFRKNISSKIIYAMWLAVVLRLCLPFNLILIDMPQMDLFGAIGSAVVYEQTADENEKVPLQQTPSAEQNGNTVLDSQTGSYRPGAVVSPGNTVNNTAVDTSNNIQNDVADDTVNDTHGGVHGNVQNDAQVTLPATSPIVPETMPQTVTPQVPTENIAEDAKLSVKQLIIAVWIAGSAVTLCVFGISWLVFNVKLVKNRRFYGKSGRTKIYVSDKITSPCALGVIPKIYITPEAEKSEFLSVILLHEKTHLAHGDHLWNIVRVAAVVAHWWNPVIWLSAVLSKRDAELACDEAVSKKLDSRERIEYARMIVDMTPERKNCAISFAGGPIKERVLKLTKEHKNKIIIAVIAVILVAACVTVAFIGAKEDGGDSAETTVETVEITGETETTAEETTEPEPEPEPIYGLFKVYEATEENIAKYETVKKYDVSTGEYSFSLLLIPTEDIADLAITKLMWNEELLLGGEEIIETVGEVKAGEGVLLTTDSVETIGYVGLSYTVDGETVRYYPATSGMDGSALLVEIGREQLSVDLLYPGLPKFEVTVSDEVGLAGALYALQYNEDGEMFFDFAGINEKVVAVYGLSTPMYMEFSDRWNVRSVSAWGNIVHPTDCGAYYPHNFSLAEYDGALVFKNNHDVYTESWVITPDAVRALTVEEGIATELVKNDDDTLSYKRYTVKYNQPAMTIETLVLDIALNRDELVCEKGKARFEDGKLILEEADISEKVGDVYDLDGIFERYPLYFSGYDSADDILARNRRRESGEESIFAGIAVMPNENHIGSWSDGGDDVVIREVTADTVEFSAGLFRLFGFDGTATLVDGVWKFTDNTSRAFEDKIKGRLEFTEDSVTIVYESDGSFDYLRGEVSRTFSARHYSVQSTVFVSGVIDTCTGVSSSYGNKILGHYDLTCVSFEDNYSLTPRVTICNGGCVASDKVPIAEYGVEDGWQYPVKVYVNEFDESVKDIYPSQYIESKRTANYVFDIGNGMHFNIQITRYDLENHNNLLENEQELLDNIAKSCHLEYTLLNNKTGEEYPTVKKIAEVSPDHLAKAETDIRYKWITSFIGKDVEGCAEVLQADKYYSHDNDYTKTMAPLKDIYFGSYSVTDIEDDDPVDEDRLMFEFTVVKSDYDAYPVGHYKAELSAGSGTRFDFIVNFIERPMDPELEALGEDVIGKMLDTLTAVDDLFDGAYNVNFPDDPYSDEWGWRCMSEHLVKTYFDTKAGKYYHSIGSDRTVEDLAGWIFVMNGNGPFKLHEDLYDMIDGEYYIGGHGGVNVKRDIIALNGDIAEIVNGRADIFSVDIRYYTDMAEFGEAFVVRYTFDRVASVYGLKLHKIEKIKDNGYDNWGYLA